MFQPSSIAVAEAVVTWASIIPLLYPRVDPQDQDVFGGDLSRGYRMTFFFIGILVTVRSVLTRDFRVEKEESGWAVAFFAQVAVESFLNSFLSLLMPYLLQCQLRDRINIRPGQSLLKWLVWILVLQVIGMVGQSYVHDRCWAIKRVGDSLSVFPVVSTANLHHQIIQGQMKTTHQTLKAIEWTYFACTWFAVASYTFYSADNDTDIFRGFRVAGYFLPRFRLFFHGFLLNVTDEAFCTRQPTSSAPPPTSASVSFVQTADDDENLSTSLVALQNAKREE